MVVDSDLRSIVPEWIELLAGPILKGGFDYVTPLYQRYKYDGTITNTVTYPLNRALYGLRIRQNLERIMAEETCPACRGMRLRPEALQFRIGGRSIGVIAAAFVGAAIGRFAERSIPKSIARQVVVVLVACAVTYSIGELVGVNV